jgi:hypothetical protein
MIALIACGSDSISKKDAVNTIQDTVENKFQRVDLVSDTIRRTRMEYQVFEPNKLDWVYFGNTYSETNITNEDLLMIEQIIDSFILSNHSAKRLSRETLGKYRYQITGAESGDQNKKAFIQAICTEMASKDNWRKKRLMVDDGGDCYFELLIDIDDRRLIRSGINSSG